MRLSAGDWINITDGPHTSSNGRVDFIDTKGGRVLVDFGGGRKGGLTWIERKPFYCEARSCGKGGK